MGDQFLSAHACALAQYHLAMYGLAPVGVRYTDDGRHEHRGVRRKRRLDLDRVDVEATTDDHVLEPVDDEQEPILVDVAHVTRAPRAIDELGRGALGIA